MITFFNAMKFPLGFSDVEVKLTRKMKDNYITAEVVGMEIDRDEYGFVYFNELLYKTMRRVYGQRRVKNMIIVQHELETMLKIEEIQNKSAKKSRMAEKQEIGSVNPFLLKMFMNISFKAWYKIYLDNKVVRDEEKEVGEYQEREDLLSPVEKDTITQQQREEDYFYLTEDDVPYYSESEDDSESEYDEDDEDDEDDENDPDEYENERNKSQEVEDLHELELELSNHKVEQVELKTERIMKRAQEDEIVLPLEF